MFTVVVRVANAETAAPPSPGSTVAASVLTAYNCMVADSTAAVGGAYFGTVGGVHGLFPVQFITSVGVKVGPHTAVPVGADVVVQFGVRTIAGAQYLSCRSSADPTWKTQLVTGAVNVGSNYHVGYNQGVTTSYFEGALAELINQSGWQTGTTFINLVDAEHDSLMASLKTKFAIP